MEHPDRAPFITGLVAGAFILASLERVFRVEAVKPTYRLALLTALSFLLVAPLPLQMHLGHPERSLEMYLTPHRSSAMAMFGFVYLWYLMVVLLLEIWLDYPSRYRVPLALQHRASANDLQGHDTGYKISERSLRLDERVGYSLTVIGIPSAFLLPMVSGIAAVMLLYMFLTNLRGHRVSIDCVDSIAKYLFYIFVIDFSLEMLDLIHRIYEADEPFRSLDFMVHTSLWIPHVIVQIILGTLVPIGILGATQVLPLAHYIRKRLYAIAGSLTLVGIFAMRWNVVIGGQLFSKSLLGYTTYSLHFGSREGLGIAIFLTILPRGILFVLAKLLPPWQRNETTTTA